MVEPNTPRFQSFKSQINIDREKAVTTQNQKINGTIVFKVNPNESTFITANFYNLEFKNVPSVLYSVVVDDNDFGLHHYIRSKTIKDISFVFCNATDKVRNVTVFYKAQFP